ncbi:hypothetical protein CEP88_17910 [Roseobacter denitrificans]|uniref:Uncharacterized protein n=1 Tax=Roseobacter denitrificans (strain ATCC 33942 / OCh 114) TaxID=375451 RepID=Q169V2_ROSDO|nr:hypothetical protein [Roseobacter denitrificans]ABG31241.1 hypothetical protein RD1_1614 [Roseobacter denitrificans OCh 114]AVL54289.1 hypothetical protein CEP88_17910 [Roseobacter denitrificans]SFF98424.1 hypothetical protein SAMN05443635_10567 [Roseobacter denitrificans OCh 114]
MALLLKVKPDTLRENEVTVPRMKSADLGSGDLGSTVYVWLGDEPERESALFAVATLTAFTPTTAPQVRNPTKNKDVYRLTISDLSTDIAYPLTTNDLNHFRYVEEADGIESLGRIHRDRNDKILRLTGAEAAALAERFQN